MQIQKVQSNQTTFGTKVKMNPRFINRATVCGEYKELRKQIKILENNGCDDVLSINRIYVPRVSELGEYNPFSRVFAEVYQIKGNKLIQGNFVEAPAYEIGPRGGHHFPNIVDLYNKAKESVKDNSRCGTQISKWVDYI